MATTEARTTEQYDQRASALTPVDYVAFILLIVGGLNWLLVGAFSFDLVAAIFGPMSTLTRIVYIVVGLSAIYVLVALMKLRRR